MLKDDEVRKLFYVQGGVGAGGGNRTRKFDVPLFTLCSSAIWLIDKVVNGHILRTPCAQYGNFSIIKQGFILPGSTLQAFENLDVEECEFECIKRQNCRSINTKFGSGVNCELVSKSIDSPFDKATLSSQSGWSYRTTSYSENNVS